MAKKVLEDSSGVYFVPGIVSIHPLEKRDDKRDQSKITAVHTAISTAGGQTHHTNIPFDEAYDAVMDHWQPQLTAAAPQKDPQG